MFDALDKLENILNSEREKQEEAILEDTEQYTVVSHPDEEDAEEAIMQQVRRCCVDKERDCLIFG